MSVIEVPTPPTRSPEQVMRALALANKIRCHRADLKAGLKARRVGLFDVMDDPRCDTMKIRELLLAIPKLGPIKVDWVMRKADIAPSKTCAGITDRQRQRLAQELAFRFPNTTIVYRAA